MVNGGGGISVVGAQEIGLFSAESGIRMVRRMGLF